MLKIILIDQIEEGNVQKEHETEVKKKKKKKKKDRNTENETRPKVDLQNETAKC